MRSSTIRDAEYGIAIRNLVAPSLDSLSFQNIATAGTPPVARHILLDNSDVFVPYGRYDYDPVQEVESVLPPGGRWNLLGGTNVVATNTVTPSLNTPIGDSTKVNLVIQGAMFTAGSAASGDTVTIRPETRSDATGDDWGGMWIESNSKSDLDYVDIGHAATPVFFFYPDSSTGLRHSRVHHFADLGIWVYKSNAGGGVLEWNVVERGAGLDAALGNAGVLLDRADQMSVFANSVSLTHSSELEDTGSHYGLHVFMGKTFCLSSPPQTRSVTIDSTTVQGNGQDDQGVRTGLFCDYVCGSANRAVSVTRNRVQDWNHIGLRFYQCGDIQVSCNRVERVPHSVDFTRNTEATGSSVRFRQNWLDVTGVPSPYGVTQTDNAPRFDLGPDAPFQGKGRNQLRSAFGGVALWEDDPTNGRIVKAQDNAWFNGGANPVDPGAAQLLRTHVASTTAEVDSSGFDTVDPGCPACVPGCQQQGGTQSPAGLGVAAADAIRIEEDALRVGAVVPERTSLSRPRPNPSSGLVTLEFGVGRDSEGAHSVVIYDVSGRRVRTVLDSYLRPGVYAVQWDGRSSSGAAAASGVYFVRMEGPGFRATDRILMLD